MNHNFVQMKIENGIATITIIREEALNALNLDVIEGLTTCLNTIAADNSVGVVIITGSGRAFIAGADIAQMKALSGIEGRSYPIAGQQLMNLIEDFKLPVIAAINGFALGGGNELAMACDIRIASTKAVFGQPEVNLGVFPGYGRTQRMTKLVGKGMSKYLIMTGNTISAEEAYRIGLVEKVVEPEALMEVCEKIAATILAKAPIAIQLAKTAVNTAEHIDVKSGMLFEKEAIGAAFNTEDRIEGMSAFIDKRKPEFKNK